ncbi:peptide chain release factor 2 [Desulfuromonas acetoxidans]|uniref:peptide chain release factor 2 n=1 Tax=Desulfuromonas acetoxidans TaxID=891 RepID=UPI0003259E83|nr:peptide chain release factor 2 [Desulfuromonas acetoxidans]MBF0645958.1 peptide chain release factor 2 [Desulfuromonas acetoxidans]NVD25467.1 peptide chain release factor 2 [Desulfuromonas acetoxidans]NVE17583.1 peptide chain release factor 2 [Desulfuromonas acetoxidans]
MFREEIERINQVSEKLTELRGYLDIPTKQERISELEADIADPDFWNQGDRAQELLKERTALQKLVDGWTSAAQTVEDLEVLVELGAESEDEATRDEVRELLPELERQVDKMEFARMLSGEHDSSNAILSINAGAGGTEAQDWADMLLRMYLRFCDIKGFKTKITDYQPGDDAGVKSVTFTVEGDYAYGWLRPEMGIHRLVRISPFDAASKRHTSFCSVFVFPELDDSIEVELLDKDMKIDTFRASGAGGQHINKTDSAIRITHIPSGIVVACQDQRSQHNNKAEAIRQLKARLYELERQKKEEEANALSGDKKEIGWGSQIRSYVLHPYRMVKDHRTGFEVGNADSVLDGHIEGFIEAYLLANSQ